jgi:hypothetical protein
MPKSIVRILMGSSIAAALVAVSLTTATPASAQRSMRQAQMRQKAEIRNGVKSGKLTKQQAARLSQQEKHIDAVAEKDRDNPNAVDRAALKRDMVHQQNAIQTDEKKNSTSTTPAANPSSSTPPLN